MIYIRNLSSDEKILLLLKELLNHNTEICKIILKQKKTIESNEIRNYYSNRYEKIAKEHYYLHANHTGKFSYIHDRHIYVLKKDFKLDYYNYTGISYQIIELIHELIKLKNEKYLTKDEGYEYWLNYDDNLYSLLSKKIMKKMKNI
tara:strand:- start:1760 stop:2197 length:438 start_codon:yes stop_codon:yes gene_type:complete